MEKKQVFYSATTIDGIMDYAVRFVIKNQLKNRDTWKRYADFFVTREDSLDERWRGEYFGKLMRGACCTYQYVQDEELYQILTWACEEILTTQDEYGRFATYHRENEFTGWDMWSRKYVLSGLQYFYRICKDENLKGRILNATCKHLDYIVKHIGKDKIHITETSTWWGAVNACSILEPVVEQYKMSGRKEYLDFAEYIISTGGSSDCNLIELALDGSLKPYQYPVTKAYEMMSFYEGLLAYYEVTGEKMYFDAVNRFIEAVAESDITIIGCSGCTHELFDHSIVKQTEPSDHIMQETCVTVTWMRLIHRMYLVTHDCKYIDRIEVSGFNALYGSLNTENCMQLELGSGKLLAAKTFDSYSPLYMNSRGKGIGGFITFSEEDYGGCCVAIGACGVSLMPLSTVVCDGKTVYINEQFNGETVVRDSNNKEIVLKFASNYPKEGKCIITVSDECDLNLMIRHPAWCDRMKINGVETNDIGYKHVEGHYQAGDQIVFEWQLGLKVHRLNGKTAFTYGSIVMAADSAKTESDIELPVNVSDDCTYRLLEEKDGEIVRIECDTNSGTLLLTDYQSCGKNWLQEKNKISVWLNS